MKAGGEGVTNGHPLDGSGTSVLSTGIREFARVDAHFLRQKVDTIHGVFILFDQYKMTELLWRLFPFIVVATVALVTSTL